MAWDTSTRRLRLPPNWQALRRAVSHRAGGMCEWAGCDQRGRHCDHIIPGDDHSLGNLQWLCKPHHDDKTRAEASARNERYERARSSRHPGLT